MIDVINFTATVAQFNQDLDRINQITRRQGQLFTDLGLDTQAIQFRGNFLRFSFREIFCGSTRSKLHFCQLIGDE